MSGKLRVATLGCKVNQYETELVRQGLQRVGYTDCNESEAADICIVNTCTVTSEGDSKSRQIVRRLNRQNPDARIVVMGCYATRAPGELAKLPGVAEVVTDKRELPDLMSRFGVIDVPTGLDGFSGRRRAYVKVQDGCMLRCSYCIIPHVRPKLTSRPLDHIIDEVQRLTAAGHREVVLTGIHLGHYGVDWNRNQPKEQWIRLAHLLRRLCELPGEFRIRLSSIEATEVTRELISVMTEHWTRIVPHLHLCLQSGSDSVLRRMRRRWGTRMFLDRCRLLREVARRAGNHHRCDRRIPRRNRSRVRANAGDLPGRAILENPRFSVQFTAGNTGRRNGRPSAQESAQREGQPSARAGEPAAKRLLPEARRAPSAVIGRILARHRAAFDISIRPQQVVATRHNVSLRARRATHGVAENDRRNDRRPSRSHRRREIVCSSIVSSRFLRLSLRSDSQV